MVRRNLEGRGNLSVGDQIIQGGIVENRRNEVKTKFPIETRISRCQGRSSSAILRTMSEPPVTIRLPRCAALCWCFLLTWLFLEGAVVPLQAGSTIFTRRYNDEVEITIESVFANVAVAGMSPLRVTLRNQSAIDRVWNIEYTGSSGFRTGQARASFSLQAPAGSGETVHEIMIPFLRSPGGWANYSLRISCSGLGSDGANQSGNPGDDWPQVALSNSLANRNAANLTAEASKTRSSSGSTGDFASSYQPGHLPSDWRGYTSLDQLMITDTEWLALLPAQRSAILEWNRLGGHLFIFSLDADGSAVLKKLGLEPRRSQGTISLMTWDGKDVPVRQVVVASDRPERFLRNSSAGLVRAMNRSEWPLAEVLGPGENNPIVVVLILLVFAIVVGPVNLFVLAKPGYRHRLFVTIPVISLGASLLLLLGIFISDGMGGNGQRILFMDLQSGNSERRAYLLQQQICHTGILLGGGFELEEGAMLTPLKLSTSFAGDRGFEYLQRGQRFSGNLFQSRADQGLEIITVRPTRARLEKRPSADAGAGPKLFSSLDFAIDDLFFVAEDGGVWRKSGRIESGQEIVLQKADPKEIKKWWEEKVGSFDKSTGVRLKRLTNNLRPGEFFAVSTDSRIGPLKTLGSIRWGNDKAVIHGSVASSGSEAPTP